MRAFLFSVLFLSAVPATAAFRAIPYSPVPLPPSKGGTGTTTTFTPGSVVVADGSGHYTQDNANFFLDLTNHSLGLGNAAPGATFRLNVTGPELINSASAQSFVVGPNGATNPAFIIDGSAASSATGLSLSVGAPGSGPALSAISSATNEGFTLNTKGNGSLILNTPSINALVSMRTASGQRFAVSGPNFSFTPTTSVTASTIRMSYVGAADTTLTGATEAPNWYINLGQTRQHGSGTITLQRDVRLTASTHSFSAANTITDAVAMSIDGPPQGGTNATLTRSVALDLPAEALTNVATGIGLRVAAPTGGTTANYAALFTSGNVGIGTSTPGSALTVAVDGTSVALGSGSSTGSSIGFQNRANVGYNSSLMGGAAILSSVAGKGLVLATNANTTLPALVIDSSSNVGIGTLTPGAPLTVFGHEHFTGTAPTVSTGALDCGTAPALVGNDNVGRVTVGSGTNGGACTLTFAVTWTNAPICMVEDETTNILTRATSVGTGSFKISGVLVAGDSLTYRCIGYQ